ncbi:3'-5' exoribonuclease [Rhizobium ruizarguesonis]|uniref:3'-5' exoribonuclease domain-containing protein n=1 Tax=Rhizobium ruizarguesonis TaxID=2081791 RepID=UPI00163B060B|nr:3'-5' exoribonuclease [Rhizobium ruizarguesonis]MBC2806627.1 3'-5' exoribonuclease [Rhizobium ruizarguesonis]
MDASAFLDIMVDTETTGTDHEHNSMIQLSAVKFDLATQSVQPFTEFFDRCLLQPKNRFFDEECRTNFWGKRPKIYHQIQARAEPPAVVMRDFVNWVGFNNPKPVRFWAKPTTFDWGFVTSYLRQYELENPFHYRWAMDMNSFIRGLAGDPTVESHYVAFQGEAHNAIMDVLNQINQVFEAVNKYGNR